MYLTILLCFSLLYFLVRFGGGLGMLVACVLYWVAGRGMGRLCLGERLGVSMALCPPG
jgi:hypothetical protein